MEKLFIREVIALARRIAVPVCCSTGVGCYHQQILLDVRFFRDEEMNATVAPATCRLQTSERAARPPLPAQMTFWEISEHPTELPGGTAAVGSDPWEGGTAAK